MLIAQITDCHIVEPGQLMADRVDTSRALARAIATINALRPLPDVVLATGDLVNDGLPAQYDQLMLLLAELAMPVLPIPGNHDDRTELRQRFAGALPPGSPDERIDYVVDDHEVRLIGLDTMIPGRKDGRVVADQMEWLDRHLAAGPARPTLVFQHHPPFPSGIPWMDRDCGFAGVELEREVIARHRQIEAIVCGHLHRSMHRRFAGAVASSWPSTGAQLSLLFGDEPVEYCSEPAAVALHRYQPGDGFTSHLIPVVDAERWTPAWAQVGGEAV